MRYNPLPAKNRGVVGYNLDQVQSVFVFVRIQPQPPDVTIKRYAFYQLPRYSPDVQFGVVGDEFGRDDHIRVYGCRIGMYLNQLAGGCYRPGFCQDAHEFVDFVAAGFTSRQPAGCFIDEVQGASGYHIVTQNLIGFKHIGCEIDIGRIFPGGNDKSLFKSFYIAHVQYDMARHECKRVPAYSPVTCDGNVPIVGFHAPECSCQQG